MLCPALDIHVNGAYEYNISDSLPSMQENMQCTLPTTAHSTLIHPVRMSIMAIVPSRESDSPRPSSQTTSSQRQDQIRLTMTVKTEGRNVMMQLWVVDCPRATYVARAVHVLLPDWDKLVDGELAKLQVGGRRRDGLRLPNEDGPASL